MVSPSPLVSSFHFVQVAISESLLDFLQKSRPLSKCSEFRRVAFAGSIHFVNLHNPQNALLI